MSENNPPSVSVVMTVYNASKYLAETIESILGQTLTDFEFIIVDNASTDGSQDIVREYNDSRINFIVNEQNLGQTKALNVGIRASRTSYIARMDADDIALPQRLQTQYVFLKNNPDIGLVGSRAITINQNGNAIGRYNVPVDPSWLLCCLCGSGDLTRWSIIHPSVMLRKPVLDKTGLYNEEKSVSGYPQDYDLWSRVVQNCRVANIAQPLLKYRVLAASESRSFSEILKYRLEISREKVKHYLPDLSNQENESLARMLEFLPQESYSEGEKVLDLFDQYFDIFVRGKISQGKKEFFKTKIKLYYLPQLGKTNKLTCRRLLFKFIIRHPQLLGDPYFYGKIIKSGKK